MTDKITLIAYVSAAVSVMIFVYSVFGPDVDLRDQGKYWFLFSVVSLFMPDLREMRSGELMMKRELVLKLSTLEGKVDTIARQIINFDIAKTTVYGYLGLPPKIQATIAAKVREPFKHALDGLSDEEAQERLQKLMYEEFAKQLEEMPKENASQMRALLTTVHLEGMALTISDLKEKLSQLGFYKGEKDNEYDNELEKAILAFQNQYKVKPVDGICGGITYGEIQKVTRGFVG
jgi:hypothetical protein